jgi:hypothetical protein
MLAVPVVIWTWPAVSESLGFVTHALKQLLAFLVRVGVGHNNAPALSRPIFQEGEVSEFGPYGCKVAEVDMQEECCKLPRFSILSAWSADPAFPGRSDLE